MALPLSRLEELVCHRNQLIAGISEWTVWCACPSRCHQGFRKTVEDIEIILQGAQPLLQSLIRVCYLDQDCAT
ncbi:hypothetical protein ASF71_20775 [Deinococcus sp. Leaf326]|nr:hypothetical protein ASF71_20775 [Deinococcus sp. Leaf326]